MKTLFVSLTLLAATPALATPTCYNYEDKAAAKLEAVMRQDIINAFQKKGIALDPSQISLSLSDNTTDDNDTSTTYFSPVLQSFEVISKSGTKFWVTYSEGSTDSDGLPDYLPVLKSNGFDHEGNPINPHCNMQMNDPFSNSADSFKIENEQSGVAIATIALPKTFQAY